MNPPILPDSLYFYLFWDSLLSTVYLTSISKEVWESVLIKRQRDSNLETSLIFWLLGWLYLESKAKLLNMPVRDVLDWQWSYEDPLYMWATPNGSSPLEGAQKKKVLAFPLPSFLSTACLSTPLQAFSAFYSKRFLLDFVLSFRR